MTIGLARSPVEDSSYPKPQRTPDSLGRREENAAVGWNRPDCSGLVMVVAERVPGHAVAQSCEDLVSTLGGKVNVGGAGIGLEPELEQAMCRCGS
jgi:hypothetical protein